jgi:hypothetical protein
MLPLHWATLMLATPSATCQSPVGSAANADPEITLVAKINPENAIVRANDLGQCNMVRTYALLAGLGGRSKRRIGRFQLTKQASTEVSSQWP